MTIVGVSKRAYPALLPSGSGDSYRIDDTEVVIKFVCTVGEVNDYAVYAGVGPDDWVAAHGNKLYRDEAVRIFPALADRTYRA